MKDENKRALRSLALGSVASLTIGVLVFRSSDNYQLALDLGLTVFALICLFLVYVLSVTWFGPRYLVASGISLLLAVGSTAPVLETIGCWMGPACKEVSSLGSAAIFFAVKFAERWQLDNLSVFAWLVVVMSFLLVISGIVLGRSSSGPRTNRDKDDLELLWTEVGGKLHKYLIKVESHADYVKTFVDDRNTKHLAVTARGFPQEELPNEADLKILRQIPKCRQRLNVLKKSYRKASRWTLLYDDLRFYRDNVGQYLHMQVGIRHAEDEFELDDIGNQESNQFIQEDRKKKAKTWKLLCLIFGLTRKPLENVLTESWLYTQLTRFVRARVLANFKQAERDAEHCRDLAKQYEITFRG